nr:hypothetical protein [Variovorax boronicumulans]
MKTLRCIATIAALAFSTLAAGQAWPSRPITILAAAPAGMPVSLLPRLEQELHAAVQSTALKARFQVDGLVPVGNSAAQMRQSLDTYGRVIDRLVQAAGVRLD